MHFKRFLACTLIAASLCAGVTGCVKKGESNADPTESSAVESSTEGSGYENADATTVKGWCESIGGEYMTAALQYDFGAMINCCAYEDVGDSESALYSYFDKAASHEWSSEFFYDMLANATVTPSNFVYDLNSKRASIDFRVAIPDYTSSLANSNAVLRYVVPVNFALDTDNGKATVLNPAVVIDSLYVAAINDYNTYLLDKYYVSPNATPTPTPAATPDETAETLEDGTVVTTATTPAA